MIFEGAVVDIAKTMALLQRSEQAQVEGEKAIVATNAELGSIQVIAYFISCIFVFLFLQPP